MSAPRPLLRPAVILDRSLLAPTPAGGVARTTALTIGAWKRLGFVCVAVSAEKGTGNDVERARAELALRRRIDASLRGAGGALDGTYVFPRPGEEVDTDAPRASVFARLLLEAAAKHRIDLPRSLLVATCLDAVEGARIAGLPCALLAGANWDVSAELRARPSARPDFVCPDVAAVAELVERQRTRALQRP